MLKDPMAYISIALTIAYLIFAVAWVPFAGRKVLPWMRNKLGQMLGVSIGERMGFRDVSWEIRGEHSFAQGCVVSIAQFFSTFGCLALPLFVALGAMGLILFWLSGDFG